MIRWLLLLAVAALALSAPSTASNTVQPTHAGIETIVPVANEMRPVECSALDLTGVVIGSGNIVNGSADAELIVGSAAADGMTGGDGDDCLVGGAGDDHLDAGPGQDVCIGGAGTNEFVGCETQL